MTNARRDRVWRAAFDAVLPRVSDVEVDLGLPGQWAEGETGLIQNWHRDYDPTLGRYLQADPLGLAAGQSLYGYAGGDPINRIDPMGLQDYLDQSLSAEERAADATTSTLGPAFQMVDTVDHILPIPNVTDLGEEITARLEGRDYDHPFSEFAMSTMPALPDSIGLGLSIASSTRLGRRRSNQCLPNLPVTGEVDRTLLFPSARGPLVRGRGRF